MSETADDYGDLLEGGEHRGRKRLIWLTALLLAVAGGAYALWAMVLSGGGQATAAVQTATVETGSIATTVSTTGTVAAQSTTSLSFSQSGKVTAVDVRLGQEVKQGDVLAEVDSSDLQRSLTTAQVGLSSAQTRLSQLLEGSTASALASADQSLVQAQASYDEAVRALQDLQAGPTVSDQLSAQQAVTSAQAQLDQAKLALSDLTAAPTGSEELAAEGAVTSAQSQVDQANRALSDLQAPPTASEQLSAQQAVTAAQNALDSAQSARAQLNTSNSDAVTAAQHAEELARASLLSAEAAYCAGGGAGYTGTPTPTPTPVGSPGFCSAQEVPLLQGDVNILTDIMNNDPDAAHAAQAASLLAANTAYLNAQTALATAQAGPSSEDIARADAAVTAAQQALDAANAKLAELNAGPTQSALDTAKENVTTATAALNTAKAKLTELNQGATQSDRAKAQDNVVTAGAGLATAQAKLTELNQGATPSDLAKAQDAVNTAAAALTATQAKHDETYAGSTPEDLALQRDQLQLAQLSVAQAQKNLDGTKLVAPYDGTVAALNIAVGDMAAGTSTTAPIVLNTPNAVRLNLTVTESDLPSVKAGQSGIATFDALSGTVFPIVIDSIGTNPTTTQGVVTYEVRARFVPGATGGTPGATSQGAAGGGRSTLGGAAGGSATPTAGTPAAGATPSAGARVPGARASAAAGTPVPGATPPAGAGAPGGNATPPAGTPVAGGTPAAGAGAPQATATSEARPEPGMNATVIITVQQAQNVLVVPDRAIQTQGGNSVVQVQKDDGSTDTVVVQTGLTNGTNTEITSGLEEGQTVILPGRAVTTTSAQATPRTGTQGGGITFGGGDSPPGD